MKNEYEVRGENVVIFINSPKYGILEALISAGKLERAKEFPSYWGVIWSKKCQTFYVIGNLPRNNGKQNKSFLHRWITNDIDGMLIDHKNHNGLYNNDENLRIVTNYENSQNKNGANKNSKSGIRGVCWHAQCKKWRAQVKLNGNCIHLGLFTSIKDAERAIKEARAKLMPYSQEALAN